MYYSLEVTCTTLILTDAPLSNEFRQEMLLPCSVFFSDHFTVQYCMYCRDVVTFHAMKGLLMQLVFSL